MPSAFQMSLLAVHEESTNYNCLPKKKRLRKVTHRASGRASAYQLRLGDRRWGLLSHAPGAHKIRMIVC